MVTWKYLNLEKATKIWDGQLITLPDYTFYQSFAWGRYKAHLGWQVYHFVGRDDHDNVVAMVQGLVKILPFGFGVFWAAGGPVGNIKYINQDLVQIIRQVTGAKRLVIRIRPHICFDPVKKEVLHSTGWSECQVRLISGQSMLLNNGLNKADLSSGLTKNWKRNLKRSKRYNLKIEKWENPNGAEIYDLYRRMETYKGLAPQYSKQEIVGMCKHLKNHIVFYRCVGKDGNLSGIRACSRLGYKAWDQLAAVDEAGRKRYVSYALIWQLLLDCGQAGVKEYDLCGVDLKNGLGVYNFKKGTGAKLITYLGEMENSSSWMVKKLLDWKIKRLGGFA